MSHRVVIRFVGLASLAGFSAACAAAPPPSPPAPPPAASAPAASITPAIPAPPPEPPTPARVAAMLLPIPVAPSPHNLIKNASFDGGKSLPWMTSFSKPAEGSASIEGGAYCLEVRNAGAHEWDAQFRHREMTIQKGHKYSVRFKIASTAPTDVLVTLSMSGPPYKAYWRTGLELGAEPKVVNDEFTMRADDDPTAELAFHAGGSGAAKAVPFSVCVDDVVLEDPEFQPKAEPPPMPVPNVLVSQGGYLPYRRKVAIVKTRTAAAPSAAWELVDRAGKVVASGATMARGADAASGDTVAWADFSSFTKSGTDYTLRAGADASHAFDIGPSVYKELKYDALAFFYHQRSGIPITTPYAGGAAWTRPAGHVGDRSVPCAPDAGCDYALDVSGGWYDAGDHGKYVVSGAIATWTLLDLYERGRSFGGTPGDLADGKMNIPENHNGKPDLLDEVRWELDFMLKMQVPEGKPMSGMVHHKVHDREWTALATRPDQDAIPRFLRPVSTAATLDLAAAAAQAARVWRAVDRDFSARCLAAAERAWTAAAAHPDVYAPVSDTVGGGPYEDRDVSDELYWAAAELYVTTKKDVYKEAMARSPFYLSVPSVDPATAFDWQHTAALGTISLAVAPNGLPLKDLTAARDAIVKAADGFAATDASEGYRVPFKGGADGKYPWGSTSFVLNDAIALGLAYDFTRKAPYVDAMVDALAYVLGRNPLDQSFVTGFGARPLEHPHHRFWAHQANAAFPSPPPGALSGGPNSGLQDPYVKAAGLAGCAPMKCYADNIEAYSANEVAINWNAPLAWVAAFLDEHGSVR